MLCSYFDLIRNYPDAFLPDLFLLLAVSIGLVNFRYLSRKVSWLFWLVVFSMVIEIGLIHEAANARNNHFLVNLNSLIETICFAGLYAFEITYRRSRLVIIVALVVYTLGFAYTFQWTRIAEYMIGVQRFILILYVLLHFQFLLSQSRVPNLLNYPLFWISTGVLLYAAGTMFIFLFGWITFSTPTLRSDFRFYLQISRGFASFFYTVIAAGFWLSRREGRLDKRLTS